MEIINQWRQTEINSIEKHYFYGKFFLQFLRQVNEDLCYEKRNMSTPLRPLQIVIFQRYILFPAVFSMSQVVVSREGVVDSVVYIHFYQHHGDEKQGQLCARMKRAGGCDNLQTNDRNLANKFLRYQWRIQDFPDWGVGRQPLGLGQSLLFDKLFAKNCIKMKDIGLGGGARPYHPPMITHPFVIRTSDLEKIRDALQIF